MISLFGNGFIGGSYAKMFSDEVWIEPRENNIPRYNNILYTIGSTTNYNMFDSLQKDISDNLIKLNKVLENCKDKDINITFLSSWFTYGKLDRLPVKETDQGEIYGYYSICKKATEQMLITFCKVYKKNYKILRLSNIVGKCDKKVSEKKNALQFLINKIKNNEDVNLYWGGEVTRDFMYIDDCSMAINHLIKNGEDNEIYNVGNGEPINFLKVLTYVKRKTNSSSKFIDVKPSEFHDIVQNRNFYLDISKLKETGFKSHYNIDDMLDILIK